MKKGCLVFSFLFFIFLPSVSQGFDCRNIPFGTELKQIDNEGYFVKYMEKEGVSFYNYTGPCRMVLHECVNAAVSYAFVDGKMYARIIRTFNDSLERIEKITVSDAGAPDSKALEGDWIIYTWNYPEKKLKSKVKFNRATRETRSALYYEPLRKLIGKKACSADFLTDDN